MEETQPPKLCSNCKQHISAKNWIIHESRCARFSTTCPKCEELVQKDQLEEHEEEYHGFDNCEMCKMRVERWQMGKHKEELCVRRPIFCEYCKLKVAMQDFPEHEQVCGSRTEKCPLCQRYVKLMDLEGHETACGQVDTSSEPPRAIPYFPTDLKPFGIPGRERQTKRALVDLTPRSSQRPPSSVIDLDNEDKVRRGKSDSNEVIDLSQEEPKPSVVPAKRRGFPASGSPTPSQETTIPCEICDKNIPFSSYDAHMGSCNIYRKSFMDRFSSDDELPRSSDPNDLNKEDKRPAVVPANNDIGDQGNSDVTEGENQGIPCELCKQNIPFDSFQDHTQQCNYFGRGDSNRMPFSGRQSPVYRSTLGGNLNSQWQNQSGIAPDVSEPVLTEMPRVQTCDLCHLQIPDHLYSGHARDCQKRQTGVSTFTDDISSRDHGHFFTPPSQPSDADAITTIPCEYCSRPIEIGNLPQHQAGCAQNPLLVSQQASRQSDLSVSGYASNPSRRLAAGQGSLRGVLSVSGYGSKGGHNPMPNLLDSDDVVCKYCSEAFGKLAIKNHKSICPKRPSYKKKTSSKIQNNLGYKKSFNTQCQHCYQMFSSSVIDDHEIECSSNISGKTDSPPLLQVQPGFLDLPGMPPRSTKVATSSTGSVSVKSEPADEENMIPCEFCGEAFKKTHLYGHQACCPFNPHLSSFKSVTEVGDSTEKSEGPSEPANEDEAIIPCDFCQREFPLTKIHSHEAQCITGNGEV